MAKINSAGISDLDAFLANVEVPGENKYIANSDNALDLFNLIIRECSNPGQEIIRQIRYNIKTMFDLSPVDSLSDELLYFRKMTRLCDSLYERNKIQLLNGKTIVGLGGHFSAGKSSFINAISGIECALPVAQEATTSIPTYIAGSDDNYIIANSIYGYVNILTEEQMNALSHEFYDTYGIGFSSFIESIIVSSRSYRLPKNVAILDTPGYTKADDETNSRMSVSDKKKAFDQLRISGNLIWLIDINNGAVTASDIDFIRSLNISTDILVVFTKADMRTQNDIEAIIKTASDTLRENGITNCFGVTAFSSLENREFLDKNLIEQFFASVSAKNASVTDPATELIETISEFIEKTEKFASSGRQLSDGLHAMINHYDGFYNISSLLEFSRDATTITKRLSNQLNELCPLAEETIALIKEYIGGQQ